MGQPFARAAAAAARSWLKQCSTVQDHTSAVHQIRPTCATSAVRRPPAFEEPPVARPTRTATRAPRPRANARPPAEHADRTPPVFTAKVTIDRARVDVPMLVLRGEWLKAIGFPIGATAFLSTDKRGDITLTRMGLTRPRKLRVVKSGT